MGAAAHRVIRGARSFGAAMADYQGTRDDHVLPLYELTTQLASFEPPPPEMQEVLFAASKSREASDGFIRMQAGTISPAEFFSESNVGKIMAAA